MRVLYSTLLSVFLLAGCSQTESVDKPVQSKSNHVAVNHSVIKEKRLYPSDPRRPSEFGNQFIPNATESLQDIIPPRPISKEPRYIFIE
ncbi:hypothetical protein [Ammoniphilus sp. 3BR4]|uniref:hypothetical protein n=1 Tax=Ammoniphilus sp. 3BR4 TaxID=3158265 RepID=UPI003467D4DC